MRKTYVEYVNVFNRKVKGVCTEDQWKMIKSSPHTKKLYRPVRTFTRKDKEMIVDVPTQKIDEVTPISENEQTNETDAAQDQNLL